MILEKTYCCCGCYMLRRSVLLDICPQRRIMVSPAGQNWQLLIPASGRYACGYIDEDLYHVAVRNGSHSRQPLGYEQAIERQQKLKEILRSAIASSGRTDRNYADIVEIKYTKVFFRLAMQYGRTDEGKAFYGKLRHGHAITAEERMLYWKEFYSAGYPAYLLWQRICGKLKRMMRI